MMGLLGPYQDVLTPKEFVPGGATRANSMMENEYITASHTKGENQCISFPCQLK